MQILQTNSSTQISMYAVYRIREDCRISDNSTPDKTTVVLCVQIALNMFDAIDIAQIQCQRSPNMSGTHCQWLNRSIEIQPADK